jgi:hypothetical protein
MIRQEIEELYLDIDSSWTDLEVVDYIESILELIPDDDYEYNIELLIKLKAEIRNEKIDNILKVK